MTARVPCALAVLVLAGACGGAGPPSSGPPSPGAATAATDAPVTPPPACVALARTCHSHDKDSGLAHECHELGHAAPSEERCLAKKDQCMKACGGEGHPH